MKEAIKHFLNKVIKKKYKASAMYFALFVSVIIGLLLGLLLLFYSTQKESLYISESTIKMVYKANLSIQNYCNSSKNKSFDKGINAKYWGGFQVVHKSISERSKIFNRMALLSNISPEYSLFLKNDNGNLKMGDGALIAGKAYVPDGYVTPSYQLDSDLKYRVEELLDNRTLPFPVLDPLWIDHTDSLYKKSISGTGFHLSWFSNNQQNSFKTPVKKIFKKGEVTITNNLYGNIIISSDRRIIINSEVDLKDVLIIAPEIKINRGFKGKVHLLAETIVMSENVELKYPSSICLLDYRRNEVVTYPPEVKLEIPKTSNFNGAIIMINMNRKEKPFKGVLKIDSGAIVNGGIYNTGFTELYGNFNGSLLTNSFISRKKGGVHVNTLLQGKISNVADSIQNNGLPLKKMEKFKISSWLY